MKNQTVALVLISTLLHSTGSIAVAADKVGECAIAVSNSTNAPTSEFLDEYGNLKNPENYAKKRGKIASLILKGPKLPDRIQKAPIGTKKAIAYFVEDFRKELQEMIDKEEINPALLTNMKDRLIQMENYKTKEQFYILRLDNLRTPMNKMDLTKRSDWLIFSHEFTMLNGHYDFPSHRVLTFAQFAFAGARAEEAKNIAKKENNATYREVYKLSTGQSLEITGKYRQDGGAYDVVQKILDSKPGDPKDLDDILRMIQYQE